MKSVRPFQRLGSPEIDDRTERDDVSLEKIYDDRAEEIPRYRVANDSGNIENWEEDKKHIESFSLPKAPKFNEFSADLADKIKITPARMKELVKEARAKWRKRKGNLTFDEYMCIFIYTHPYRAHSLLCKALSDRKELISPLLKLMVGIISGLRKMPYTKQSILFRGISCKVNYENYPVGKKRTWVPFSSVSRSCNACKRFTGKNRNGTIFIITGYIPGHDIHEFSFFDGKEFEVLIEPCFHFYTREVIKGGEDGPDFIFIEGVQKGFVMEHFKPRMPFPPEDYKAVLQPSDGSEHTIMEILKKACIDDDNDAMKQLALLYWSDKIERNCDELFYWADKVPKNQELELANCIHDAACGAFTGQTQTLNRYENAKAFELMTQFGKNDKQSERFGALVEGKIFPEDVIRNVKTPEDELFLGMMCFERHSFAIALDMLKRARSHGIVNDKLLERLKVAETGVAAENGDAAAMNRLGSYFEDGTGVGKDEKEAFKWYKESAVKGDCEGQCNLGRCYLKGLGVEVNEAKALKYFKDSAENKCPTARYYVGECYYTGKGTGVRRKKAFRCLERAAEDRIGDGNTEYSLGICCKFGRGTKMDAGGAYKWFAKAAKDGHVSAMFELGECYENGFGVKKDEKKAIEWYTKATECGNEMAMEALVSHMEVPYFDDLYERYSKPEKVKLLSKSVEQKELARDLYYLGLHELKWRYDEKNYCWMFKAAFNNGNGKAAAQMAKFKEGLGKDDEALDWWKLGASLEDPESLYVLYKHYKGEDDGEAGASDYFERSVKAGYPKALFQRGNELCASEKKEDKIKGKEMIKKAADDELREAEFQAGKLCLEERNIYMAMEYFQNAAEQGDEEAECEYALLLYDTNDQSRALDLLKKHADKGHPAAQAKYGEHYFNTLWRSYGLEYIAKAAEQRNPDGVLWMGMHFKLQKDYVKAYAHIAQAVNSGSKWAAVEMAKCTIRGEGVPANPQGGMVILMDAASRGNVHAAYELAQMYRRHEVNGDFDEQLGLTNCETDDEKYKELLLRASDMGHKGAKREAKQLFGRT